MPIIGIGKESDESKKLLREMTNKKVSYLLSKHNLQDVEVYTIIKEFFKEYLQVDYEFTFEELMEELKKIYMDKHTRTALFKILKVFSTIEYKDQVIPQETIREELLQFKGLLGGIIQEESKSHFWDKLFKRHATKNEESSKAINPLKNEAIEKVDLVKKQRQIVLPEKKIEKKVKLTSTKQDEKELLIAEDELAQAENKVVELLDKATASHRRGEKAKAKEHYKELREFYETLSDEKKKEHYHRLKKLYEDICEEDPVDELITVVRTFHHQGDHHRAKEQYKQLLQTYNHLPENRKHEFYSEINSLYKHLAAK